MAQARAGYRARRGCWSGWAPAGPHTAAGGAQVKKALPLEERADPYFDSYLGRKTCAGAPEVALDAKSHDAPYYILYGESLMK
jgi:hypothetical protein